MSAGVGTVFLDASEMTAGPEPTSPGAALSLHEARAQYPDVGTPALSSPTRNTSSDSLDVLVRGSASSGRPSGQRGSPGQDAGALPWSV